MKSRILLAGIALATLTPSVAMAQDDGCRRDSNGRIIGTVVGAGAGGLLGNVIAGRGEKTEGTIIGGIIGAVVGNQVGKTSDRGCNRAYGYYDQQGRWHATGISTNEARGYYDRDGRWVDGAPNGYYDNSGRWIASSGSYQDNGYVDSNGYWVPASTAGYYDRDNRWVGGTSSGYYDTSGRWVAGPTRGRYDSRGRWIAGDPGYSDSNGNMSTMEQPGYYDQNGRWRAGRAYGYYDSRGRWVSTGNNNDNNYNNNGNYNGNNGSYGNNGNTNYVPGNGSYNMDQMPTDIPTRISWLREYVREGERAGRIRRADANYARAELDATASQERMFNRDGNFTMREERQISRRLDRLTNRLDRNWCQARNYWVITSVRKRARRV